MDFPGINKPFDRILKALTEESPRLFLDLLGIAPLDAEVAVTPLPRETAPPMKVADYTAAVVVEYERRFLFHAEFVLWYTSDTPSEIARYGGSLAWQHQCRVVSVLVLLDSEKAPKEVPTEGVYQIFETRTIHPFRTVRMWELDPAKVIATNDLRLFPWALLMRSSDEQVRWIAEQLGARGDEESLGRFLWLGSLRYDREELESMLGGMGMGLMEAVMHGKFMTTEREKAIQEGHKGGLQQGIQQGQEAGKVAEARKLLRKTLLARFPGLEAMPEIDSIASTDAMESLFDLALFSMDRTAMEQAIRASVAPGRAAAQPVDDGR